MNYAGAQEISTDIRLNPQTEPLRLEDLVGKITCADCMDILKQLPDKCVDLVLTDPPYGIDFLSNRTDHQRRIENDKYGDFSELYPQWIAEFKRILTDTGCCCCCCCGGGKTPVSQEFTLEAVRQGFNLIQTVIWDKCTIGLGWHYRPSYETIVILSKSKDKYNWFTQRKDISNIVKIPNIIPQKGDHPTPKPVELMQHFIDLHSKENDLVIDPFSGSGTTAIACHRLNRRFICIEKDKEYYEASVKRLEDERKQLSLFGGNK
jgi:site-specific DNA-methyltransferase (adenine-specific)